MNLKRSTKFFFQRLFRGFDDRETWNLNDNIVEFIYPRLKRFRKINNGFPYGFTAEEWDEKLNKMLYAFKHLKDYDIETDEKKIDEGLKLFCTYFRDLWW